MTLCVVLAVVALASVRADVSELPGIKYSGLTNHHRSASSQYANQFGSGSLEVIPVHLAHVSTTVHRSGETDFGKGSAEYTSGYSNSQYSPATGYSSGGNNLGTQYYTAGANLGGQYSSDANFGGQYASGANFGGQYASGAGLGAQYTSGGALSSGARYTDSTDFAQNSGFTSGQGASSDASFGYHQLINDVLSGKYTVGSYSPSAYTATSQRQKININLQPNQPPITYRHVYFAEAPAEAPIRPRINIDGAIQARKHVKVVFIKTPDQGGIADQELTLPQLEEEKTQIYVLSKEHNHQPQIRIKAGNAGTASRPEIFFLKYRNEADALRAQHVLRENAGKGSFTAGAVLGDANLSSAGSSGFTAGAVLGDANLSSAGSSGFTAGAVLGDANLSSRGSSGFTGEQGSGGSSSGFASELSSGLSSHSGSSNSGYASGLSTGSSSGLTSNSGGSFQSGGNGEASQGSKGVTTLYAAPSVGDVSSGGYV